ncbi:30S ribosomal protein S19e [Candidatus Woesearchaeota archaeon]|nr:30S ribosomal protein S19e [Candidatus Woesearchaeota archaeon]
MGVHDVNPSVLIQHIAQELKKEPVIKAPAWAPFAKTGMSRERAPVQQDWWYTRAASILRKIMLLGPVGTSKLKRKYGGRKNEGMAPEHFYPGAGSPIRKVLQQLEKAGLAKQVAKGVHKGRVITPKGQQLLESVASQLIKEQGIVLAKPVAAELKEPAKEAKPKAPRKPRAKKKVEGVQQSNGASPAGTA